MMLHESASVAIKKAIEPTIRMIAARSADMAKLILVDQGITTADMTLLDLMAVGATGWLGAMAGQAFFDYVPMEEKFSLAANHFAKTCRDPVLAAKMKKAGLVCDTLSTALCNFAPMYQMIDTAITANGDEVTFPPVTELRPCSEGAIRWAQELGSPLHYRTPAPSQPIEELKPLATKICLETIKEKELISEPEMALLLSLPTKTLGNRRRANEVNRTVYIQKKRNARAWYRTAKALTALQSDTFFVTPKSGKKK